jgi:vanillate O-demethylase ferredoxin subunit
MSNEAQDIVSLELVPEAQDGRSALSLPSFTAGAHVNVHLPNSIERSYSLINSQEERHRYVIAVQKDRASRGGSRFIHESLHAGKVLTISAPINNFRLIEEARHTVLIAGGIGITPLWCMIQRLQTLGRSWELFFSVRARTNAAFLNQIAAFGNSANVHCHFDDEEQGRFMDLAAIVNRVEQGTHLYCCGPTSMLEAFELAASSLPAHRVHTEYFSPKTAPVVSGGFTVVLARRGDSVFIPPGKTILDTLLERGIELQYSCTEGVCGECETKVLEGIPDHRDVALSGEEHASNRTMMICCSGCKGEKLVLDL